MGMYFKGSSAEPLWYKDAVIYELHVKAFYDSNGDGIGDFRGLTQKLGYLEELGVTAIWLLPFYPSPLQDDGYDIADYFNVHPDYGTITDFKHFLREAHRRGIKVITELVLNHTSDQHEWFQKSRNAKKGSIWRDYYVWSDTPDKYRDARIIFQDFEHSNWTWDRIAKSYYWHRFYSHQPDLNFENPRVRKSLLKVIEFWMDMGVDGMRLDAVPYLFEEEGTNCENLPRTHGFLQELRGHIDARYSNRMLLAEANQWPEDAVAYFGNGNECHMAFHFPLMPRIFMALEMESNIPIIDIMEQTPDIPDNCQWALFLRNHDELTLEMVTDEERDYMYRVFAQDPRAKINLGIRRRLAPLMLNDRKKIELMNILLFSLPGTPVIYYGDEIGMGDNYYLGDRDGVRTPMQWSPDRNAGFSGTNPHKLYLPAIIDPEYHFEAVNAENQDRNISSLLWWMKKVIAVRKRYKAFGRGKLTFIPSYNTKVMAFIRQYEEETILVIVNMSRFAQSVELDLSEFNGHIPVDIFSHNQFPPVKQTPYVVSLGPFGYYSFILRDSHKEAMSPLTRENIPLLDGEIDWHAFFSKRVIEKMESLILPLYLKRSRWFRGRNAFAMEIRIGEIIPVPTEHEIFYLLLLKISYQDRPSEMYLLPLAYAFGSKASAITSNSTQAIIALLSSKGIDGIVYDATFNRGYHQALLTMISKRKKIRTTTGELCLYPTGNLQKSLKAPLSLLQSKVNETRQDHISISYENEFFLKLFRLVKEGINPELEMAKTLGRRTETFALPEFQGAIEFRYPSGKSIALGILYEFVENVGNLWTHTLDVLSRYFDTVLVHSVDQAAAAEMEGGLFNVTYDSIPLLFQEIAGVPYLDTMYALGQKTAGLHLSLADIRNNPDFQPESFSTLYQRSLYQSFRTHFRNTSIALKQVQSTLPDNVRSVVENIQNREQVVLDHFSKVTGRKIDAVKMRIHGDYNLSEVLVTGTDFVIIDFEGKKYLELSQRRLKQSPLRDVASMIYSLHFAAYTVLHHGMNIREEDIPYLEPFTRPWIRYMSGMFLTGYLNGVHDCGIIPSSENELTVLLTSYLIERSAIEVEQALAQDPETAIIPIRILSDLVETL